MGQILKKKGKKSFQSKFLNSGNGARVQLIDIEHPDYMAIIEPDTAFWGLAKKDRLAEIIAGKEFKHKLKKYYPIMHQEMEHLRFGLKPSAVYFNLTDRCNLNCSYCYIPEKMRKSGIHMPWKKLNKALNILKNYFKQTVPKGRKPQIVFHGAEPFTNKEGLFRAIETYKKDFVFGVQTNGTLLEKEDCNFLKAHKVVVGISLDGHVANIADRTRQNWRKQGMFKKILKALELFAGYSRFSVICTVTNQNIRSLVKIVEFFHQHNIENCLLNQVRCTLEGARKVKPADGLMAKMFTKALDRTHELYCKTGRKLIVVNFANILLSIIAPTARRLMCDISPCGGGRCFFAVSADGDVFPCSEFIGLPKFKGGNLFKNDLKQILNSNPFNLVTGREIEAIEPCRHCAIRHFCGAPCPAESYQINGTLESPGAFCEFYEYQVRYAFKLIAQKKEHDYLWNNWGNDIKESFKF